LPGRECVRRGWDACLEYKRAYAEILAHLYKTQNPWDVILLVQLRNGSRIGEAIEAVKRFCSEGMTAVRVKVEKHRDPNDTRLMVLPEELRGTQGKEFLFNACVRLAKVKKSKNTIAMYTKKTYGFSSHALRYAFITHLLKKGVSPSIIARITGHTSLNYILHYTELKTAEDILSSAL
jgi:integrase